MRETEVRGLLCDGNFSGLKSNYRLTAWEASTAIGVVAAFAIGLLGVYSTMPPSDYSFLKLPQTLDDLQTLRTGFWVWTAARYWTLILIWQAHKHDG